MRGVWRLLVTWRWRGRSRDLVERQGGGRKCDQGDPFLGRGVRKNTRNPRESLLVSGFLVCSSSEHRKFNPLNFLLYTSIRNRQRATPIASTHRPSPQSTAQHTKITDRGGQPRERYRQTESRSAVSPPPVVVRDVPFSLARRTLENCALSPTKKSPRPEGACAPTCVPAIGHPDGKMPGQPVADSQ